LKSKSSLQLISAVSIEAITHWLNSLPPTGEGERRAVLLNDGSVAGLNLNSLTLPDDTLVKSVAACACCVGALPMRTELTRLLRQAPAQILIVSTHWSHLPVLDQLLSGAPFDLYTHRLPSVLALTANEAKPEKRALLDTLFGKWQSKWVVTN
jgi:G3E family GTPase